MRIKASKTRVVGLTHGENSDDRMTEVEECMFGTYILSTIEQTVEQKYASSLVSTSLLTRPMRRYWLLQATSGLQ
jgi:hypothetical protein